MTKRGQGSI